MTINRMRPETRAEEFPMLRSWLDFHRSTLAMNCADLSDAQLREQAVPPSSLSLLGLVRHMAEVERSWFRRRFSDEHAPPLYFSDQDPDGDFDNVDTAEVAEAFATWRQECESAREITAQAASLNDLSVHTWHGETVSLRWILVHMIEEYARHNGHADLLRQRIDGAVGD